MSNLVFVSAQPDIPYFHWQCKLYTHNFIKSGISPENIHVLFVLVYNENPSTESLKLKELGVNVHYYADVRILKNYSPSIRPMAMSNWLKDNPELANCYFYHDSDIFFRKLPDFESLLEDNINYVSDTISYIGYEYITKCCKHYQSKYTKLSNEDLFEKMTKTVGISRKLVKNNQNNSGGAQYLLKNIDHTFWHKVFLDCSNLHTLLQNYNHKYDIPFGQIQSWTSDMWSVLWNLWLFEKKTKVDKELSFCFATDTIEKYNDVNIFHLSGVTEVLKDKVFYKGDFVNQDPILKLKGNERFFDYIDKSNSTTFYINLIKDYINSKHVQ